MFEDDAARKTPRTHEVGMPIESMSEDELLYRIGMLRDEIVRLEQAVEARRRSKSAADSIFKL